MSGNGLIEAFSRFFWGRFDGTTTRADEAGGIYHALNRGNARLDIFFKDADFEAFERLVAEGMEKFLLTSSPTNG